ncbi:hypothetical protein M758_11G130900 [Ceratodon purpureus]|nr:hypothetical protein M758_11G130900 [Ceratodon purpureus]
MGGGRGVATCESVPDAVFAKIFALLPSAQIASSCALVCRAWRDYTQDATLWSELCEGSGLRAIDAMRCLGGWRGLFGSVYGLNLVASPHFERVHFYEADRLKHQSLRPWEPKHRLIIDRICSDNESDEETHSYGYWATEGGSVFQRGGGDGVLRECPAHDCSPCPVAEREPVLATSWDWGKVQQYIGLQTFSNKFLDCSPPMMFSIWYAGKKGAPSVFKAQVVLRDELKNIIFVWESGELETTENVWKQEKHLIQNYPPGMRSIVVKAAGMSIQHKSGFHGAKFTAVKLQFVPVNEVPLHIEQPILGKKFSQF